MTGRAAAVLRIGIVLVAALVLANPLLGGRARSSPTTTPCEQAGAFDAHHLPDRKDLP